MLFYFSGRNKISSRTLAKYDIVVTTYGTAESEITKALPESNAKKTTRLDDLKAINLDEIDAKTSPLLSIAWQRVILDEAHQIRNPVTKTAKAICRIRAAKRWAVTGTPIQNAEKDMYSLVRYNYFFEMCYSILKGYNKLYF